MSPATTVAGATVFADATGDAGAPEDEDEEAVEEDEDDDDEDEVVDAPST